MAITYEDVEKRFSEKGLMLLTTKENYRNTTERLAFFCFAHPYEVQPGISYHKLKSGYGCYSCAKIARADNRRTNYAEIKAAFENRDYELLTTEEEFTSTQIPLRYRCLKHPDAKLKPITYHNLLKGKGCRPCANERKAEKLRPKYFIIAKKAFEDQGLVLLDEFYVDAKTKMAYKCPRHPEQVQHKTYDDVKRSGCPLCTNEELSVRQRSSQEEVATKCLALGFRIRDGQEYINAHQKLRFECQKHPEVDYMTNTDNILNGHGGCAKCKSENISVAQKLNFKEGRQVVRRGKDNLAWRGGTTEINYYLREREKEWKQKWLKYYNYTCVISGDRGGKLHVHHAEPFHILRDSVLKKLGLPIYQTIGEYTEAERIKITEGYDEQLLKIEGFSIKEEYHKEFHRIYGKGSEANRENFILFKNKTASELWSVKVISEPGSSMPEMF
ncbi:hypothetical protein [Paenibacillus sp. MMO-58]|uniref:hypothetical protein n=1 Tax=Paenibacillus sp. MMO-58 TaxID=3081290 RepID=UPI003018AC57